MYFEMVKTVNLMLSGFTTIKRINGDFPGRKGGWEGWEARFRHNKFLRVTVETLCRTESGPEPAGALLGMNGGHDVWNSFSHRPVKLHV